MALHKVKGKNDEVTRFGGHDKVEFDKVDKHF